jgi:hypothetical protein
MVNIPDEVRVAIDRLREERREARLRHEELCAERAAREEERRRQHEQLRSRAEVIVSWARGVASSGVLDGLEEGIVIHRRQRGASRQLFELRPDGQLAVSFIHYAGGATMAIASAEGLLAHVHADDTLEGLAHAAETGTIWERVLELNRPKVLR